MTPVLQIDDLTVSYRSGDGWLDAVRNASLRIEPGETVGLVGESGSGKSTLALAAMRYLPENGAVRGGSIHLAGRDLLALEAAGRSGVSRSSWCRRTRWSPSTRPCALASSWPRRCPPLPMDASPM